MKNKEWPHLIEHFGLLKFLVACFQWGTGCNSVIKQPLMFAFNWLRIFQSKPPFYSLRALKTVLSCFVFPYCLCI